MVIVVSGGKIRVDLRRFPAGQIEPIQQPALVVNQCLAVNRPIRRLKGGIFPVHIAAMARCNINGLYPAADVIAIGNKVRFGLIRVIRDIRGFP